MRSWEYPWFEYRGSIHILVSVGHGDGLGVIYYYNCFETEGKVRGVC